jgi:hypothetical protein
MIQAHGFKPRLVAEWNSRAAFQCLKGNDPAPYWLTEY